MSNTIQLTKPAAEYDSDERKALWNQLVKENRKTLAAKNGGWLTGSQRAAAKGMASRSMLKAGF